MIKQDGLLNIKGLIQTQSSVKQYFKPSHYSNKLGWFKPSY